MIQKRLHIAPKVDAISPLGVTDKPFTVGALFFNVMKEIKLTKGFVTMVDDEDYEKLMRHKWQCCIDKYNVYAHRTQWYGKTERKLIIMHRFIMGLTNEKLEIDHIDHNGLNNQKSNLRICTKRENQYNRFSKNGSYSKYIGVSYNKSHKESLKTKRWNANIRINYKLIFIGCFNTEDEAAIARDEYVIKNGLDFCNLNILKR
jgi:hypothetical protein